MDLGSGMFGMDLSTITEGSDAVVLPDVSYGGADEQPNTPAGNGFGTFFMGALDKAINYAIAKDSASWARPPTYYQAVPRTQMPNAYAQQTPLGLPPVVFWGLIIGGGILLLKD